MQQGTVRSMGAVVVVCTAIVLGACYAPSFERCAVVCNAAAAAPCPNALTCGGDGFCHAAGDPETCNTGIDGGLPDADTDGGTDGIDAALPVCEDAGALPDTGAPPPVGIFESVDTGYLHTCGIDDANGLWCWGENDRGQLGVGDTVRRGLATAVTGASGWTMVSAGDGFSCGIRQAVLLCWGDDGYQTLANGAPISHASVPTAVSGGGAWKAIAAGGQHACGIKTDGSLWCWGSNSNGQLGLGNNDDKTLPTRTGTDTDWLSVSTGGQNTCAIKTGGALYCWGAGSGGRVGDGATVDRNAPVPISAGTAFRAVSTSEYHSQAITTGDKLLVWGLNGAGQLGQDTPGGFSATPLPLEAATSFAASAAGNDVGCAATTAGSTYCWGSNLYGVLARDDFSDAAAPVEIEELGGRTIVQLDLGIGHACARDSAGELRCWGLAGDGQVGNGAIANAEAPVSVRAATCAPIAQLSVGDEHACVRAGGALYCWGRGGSGRLGVGDARDRFVGEAVGASLTWSDVAAGGRHTCGIAAGALYCWGDNAHRQLGYPQFADQLTPKKVGSKTDWTRVFAGTVHTCAIDAGGGRYCWGFNETGAAGSGDTNPVGTPTSFLGGPPRWTSASGGEGHTCGLGDDGASLGQLWCWGANNTGQLGLGDVLPRLSPARVGLGDGWSRVATSAAGFTCAVQSGVAQCWGDNYDGQVGNGMTTTVVDAPVEVMGGQTWSDVDVGGAHSCGVTTGGDVRCWGFAFNGRLGYGTVEPDVLRFGSPADPVAPAGGWARVGVGLDYSCGLRTDGSVWCWGGNQHGTLGNGAGMVLRPTAVVIIP